MGTIIAASFEQSFEIFRKKVPYNCIWLYQIICAFFLSPVSSHLTLVFLQERSKISAFENFLLLPLHRPKFLNLWTKIKTHWRLADIKNITSSLGHGQTVECCSLEDYLDLCSDAHPVLALFSLHCKMSSTKFHSQLLKWVTSFHPRKYFPVISSVSHSDKEAEFPEDAGIWLPVGALLEC